MKRLALSAAITAMALPASALAATTEHGTVLSVNRAHHTVQVVEAGHIVHAYTMRGKTTKLVAGAVISFAQHGSSISDVAVTGHSRTVSYYASVVKTSSKHVVLRLADGQTVSFSDHQVSNKGAKKSKATKDVLAHVASAGITINILGLAPGSTVLVTETVAPDGSITISLTLPSTTGSSAGAGNGSGDNGNGNGNGSGSSSGSGNGSGNGSGSGSDANELEVAGTVTDVETDTFTIETNSGSSLQFSMDADDLSNVDMFPCDAVVVQYHVSSGTLDADNVDDNGTSNVNNCAGGDAGTGVSDAVGQITAVSDSSITINAQGQGSMTFAADPDLGLTEGFLVGDVVDVTYSLDADGVTEDASDIEYVETDEVGTVTSLSDGAMTITDATTGKPDSFIADPSEEMFSGISVGDSVDVTFHQSGGDQVADNVDDLTDDGW